MNFIQNLEIDFNTIKNPLIIKKWEDYMKNNFSFLGIEAEKRRQILKENYVNYETEVKQNFREISWDLFNKKEREFHYSAIEILIKEFKNNHHLNDIHLIEKFICTNSWWDSVDTIAKYLVGGYLNHFPNETLSVIEHFSNSENRWLNRTAIIFQLGYKEKTNFDLLKSECEKHKNSKEFFIQKAIGWALRDYSKYNPNGVKIFVENANLKPLSSREALRNIK